ncbi:aspartic peptidase domain-containing protein [Lentinula raphanica]|nr:aspartic peptidase domain-containing protein [Lentinula raphanica]
MRLFVPLPLFLVLLICLSPTSGASGSPLKRDSSSPQPSTLFIPLKFDDNKRYTVNVSLPTNDSSQSQSFAFALSTSTGISSVAGQGCVSCGGSSTYSMPSSTQMGALRNVTVLDGGVSGPIINQTCKLQLQNGSSWSWVDQSFVVANQSNSMYSSDISGILGVGTNSREGSFNETPMAFWLADNPGQTNFSYGLALNSPSDASSNDDAGTFHWLAPDHDSYEGDIVWKSLINSNSTNSINADSFVEMDAWNYQSDNGVNISAYTGLLTVVDPLFNDLVFPRDQARSIYGTISGYSRQESSSTTAVYTLPCDTRMKLTLTFGTVSATLTENQLVQNLGNSTCLGVLQEWTSENVTQYLLGASLISNIYLIFQGSDAGSSFGFANRKSSSPTLNAASIAGVVLGSLAFLIMVIIAVVLVLRWLRRRKLKSAPRITPFQYGGISSPLTISSFEASDLIPGPQESATSPSNWLTRYYFTPTGFRGVRNDRRSNMNATTPVRSSKRSEAFQDIPLPIETPTRTTYRSSTHSFYTLAAPSSSNQGNVSPRLFIRVSPPSDSSLYAVQQPQADVEAGIALLQHNPSVSSLPAYQVTDPDSGGLHNRF